MTVIARPFLARRNRTRLIGWLRFFWRDDDAPRRKLRGVSLCGLAANRRENEKPSQNVASSPKRLSCQMRARSEPHSTEDVRRGASEDTTKRLGRAAGLRRLLASTSARVAQYLARRIVPGNPGHAAAGMGAGAAHVQALERPAIVAVPEHGPGREQLIEGERAVEDVPADQAKLALQIKRRERSPRDDAGTEIRCVAAHR